MAKASAVGSPAASASLAAILLKALLPLKPLLLILRVQKVSSTVRHQRQTTVLVLTKAQTTQKKSG